MLARKLLRVHQKQQILQEFHTHLVSYGKSKEKLYLGRQSSMLKKLVTGSNRPRKKYFNVEQTATRQFEEMAFLDLKPRETPKRHPSNKSKRRMTVLSTVFCEQITNILAMGEAGDEILGLGLQLSHVKMTPDFSQINVHWEPSGTENDARIEELLPRIAARVRHCMCENRVFGIVPPIAFVKDPHYERVAQVEEALQTCDYGPDYEPTNIAAALQRMEPVTVGKKHPRDGRSVVEMEDNVVKKTPSKVDTTMEEIILNQSLEDILHGPEMRNDILGVQHMEIMNKIVHAVQQSKKSTTGNDDVPEESTDSTSLGTPLEVIKHDNERTKEFLTYLKKQHYRKQKILRLKETELERNLKEADIMDRWVEYQESITECNDVLDNDDDYFIEEDEPPDCRP